ncbi:hypothetical protein VI06_13430 [Aquitalea magnusonii]|nr:hypothetical protein VI06_13430 [Aquitalea magnusonii]
MAVFGQLCGYRRCFASAKLFGINRSGVHDMTTLLLKQGELLSLQGRLPHSLSVQQGRVWISYCGQDVILARGASWTPGKAGGETLLLEAVGGPAQLSLQLQGEHNLLQLASCG